ncbi:S8 family serine peptidase [Sodalis sp. RH22]|uniref:S8 family serine peptidase n=1 Tax=unclassified Sodalis (in: enterobacteria) TaxID=2636512 RepID=UPI0039B65885
MNIKLDYFRNNASDGNVYARCIGEESDFDIIYTLFEGKEKEHFSIKKKAYGDELVTFKLTSGCDYYLHAQLKLSNGQDVDLCSDIISTLPSSHFLPPTNCKIEDMTDIKGKLKITSEGRQDFIIQFYPGGYKRLQCEARHNVPLFFKARRYIDFAPCFDKKTLSGIIKKFPLSKKLRELYRVRQNLVNDDLLQLAQEIERLDYVEYCSLSGDPTSESLPSEWETYPQEIDTATITPDLTPYQGYLDNTARGMSVRAAWARNVTGRGVSVHMQDTGVWPDHEDLIGNITVVNNSYENRDHGTWSAGVIAASNNGIGMMGIAYDCRLFAYINTFTDFEKIVRDALPGDIVTASLGWDYSALPLVHHQAWWSMYRLLVSSGVVVVLLSGNGGLDLSQSVEFNNFGDSGVILATASHPDNRRRLEFSNYNFTRMIAAWGMDVATTGEGDLLNLGHPNRTYTANYGGTSASAPQIAGVLALIQSYAKSAYHVIFSGDQLYQIIRVTGHREGEADLIGPRPNVHAALEYVDYLLGPGEPTPPPPEYPLWRVGVQYEVGDRVSHLGLNYICRSRHVSNVGWQPQLAVTLWTRIP